MKKVLTLLIGVLSFLNLRAAPFDPEHEPGPTLPFQDQACQSQLVAHFPRADSNQVALLCQLDAEFMAECMIMKSKLLPSTEFSQISQICQKDLWEKRRIEEPIHHF